MQLRNIGMAAAMTAALAGNLASLENATGLIDREDGFVVPEGGFHPSRLARHGDICLWNDSSALVGATYQTALTAYTVGWRDEENLDALADFIAEPVQVSRRFEYKEFINYEQFLSDPNEDLRAIGGKFKFVDSHINDTTATTQNRGLAFRMDKDRIYTGWQEQETSRLLQRLKRNKARRALTLLSAAATNTAKTWDTTAGKNPDQDIKTELITATDLIGLRPNRVLYGETAWDKRGTAYDAQNNAGGYARAAITEDRIGATLAVGGAMVNRARYAASTTARTQIVNNLVLMYQGMKGAGPNDPSTMKDFWSPTDQGGQYATYLIDQPKFIILMVEHYELLKVTSTVGVRQFTIS